MLLLSVVAMFALLSITLLLGRSYHVLILLIIAGGWAQAPLISFAQADAFQYIDDIPAAALIAAAVGKALLSAGKRLNKALLLLVILVALVGLGVVRSPNAAVGIAQARQVLMPLGLVFAGFVLRDQIKWQRIFGYVLFFAVLTAVWAIAEEISQAPLIDPTYYYVDVIGGDPNGLRLGLPPSYYADIAGGVSPVLRPGGSFMNPPVMGFFLGLGAFAAVLNLRGFVRLLVLALIGSAVMFAYARAGILIFVVVTVLYLIWLKVGKHAGVIVGVGIGGLLVSTFIEQGNTASHSDGLLTGFLAGVRTAIGQGFGMNGYQAALEGNTTGAGDESLLGLYFAWLGIPMILAALVCARRLWLLLRRTPRDETLPIWLTIAFMLAVASSESASSIASTPVFWLVGGWVLAMAVPPKPAKPVYGARRLRNPAKISRAYATDRRFNPAARGAKPLVVEAPHLRVDAKSGDFRGFRVVGRDV